MGKPWEKFQKTEPPKGAPTEGAKPWEKFGAQDVAQNSMRVSPNMPGAPQSDSWLDKKLPLGTSPRGLIQGSLDALPAAGAIGGGVLAGAGTMGLAAVGGAGLGAGMGAALKNLGEDYILGKEKTRAEIYGDPALAVLEGGTAEMGGAVAGKVIAKGLNKVGSQVYKSGLKRIDQEVAKYGKEPVSDLLMEKNITGNAKQIFDRMNTLGDDLLVKRNSLLKDATRKGAEVDVKASLKEAQDFVNKLKSVENPEMKKAVKLLQRRIDTYSRAAGKEPEQILRELPYTKPRTELKFAGPNPEVPVYDATRMGKIDRAGTPDPLELRMGKPVKGMSDVRPVISEGAPKGLLDEPQLFGGDKWKFSTASPEEILAERVRLTKQSQVTPYEPTLEGWAPRAEADAVRSLPVQGKYDIVEKLDPKIATVLDMTERKAGPSPIQTTAWKTSSANRVGKKGWEELARSPEGKGFDKALSSGLRRGTEESVQRALGGDAGQTLAKTNRDLGKILTSRERALMDAQQEGRKNAFTSVDGILSTQPWILAAKKAADIAKATGPRTKIGKGLVDIGKAEDEVGVLRGLIKLGLLKPNAKKEEIPQGLIELENLAEGYEQ